MTRIPVNAAIPEELTELFAAATNGRQPPLNLHSQMACGPAVLAAYVAIRRALEEHGTLERRTRLALMLAVSTIDRCEYTQAVNTMLATRAGFDESQINAIVTGSATGDEPRRAARGLPRGSRRDGRVSGPTWQATIDAGCSDQQLADAYASIALAVYLDQFVNHADTPFDVPATTQAA